MSAPLAIDLFCGLGGWTDGLLAEGWDVVGFDIERHDYGGQRYPAQLVIQDVLTLHGSQFRNAALIVASPPCQEYSYMAMPWSRAKAKASAIRADETGGGIEQLNRLFNVCFRLQREACEAARRHIPLIVENVKGAQPWVGRARWSFGSFYLWGDVPALMPIALNSHKQPGLNWSDRSRPGQAFNPAARGQKFNEELAIKNDGRKHHGDWFRDPSCPSRQGGQLKPPSRVSTQSPAEGRKGAGAGAAWFDQNISSLPSNSLRRKAASAMIAKIPEPLARHIARVFKEKPAR